MLSFHEYIWESRMSSLRKQIAWDLARSGVSPNEIVKEIIGETRIQNEFFGGFIRRLGSAWNAFWHGHDQEKMYSLADVEQRVAQVAAEYEEQIEALQQQLKKQGSGDKEIETALYEIRKRAGGHYHEMMSELRKKKTGENAKKGGILEKCLNTLTDLQDLTQHPGIPEDQRAQKIEEAEKALQSQQTEAENLLKTATDETDKKEAQSVIDHLNDPKMKILLDSLAKIRDQVKNRVGSTASTPGTSIDAALAARSGSDPGIQQLPADPRQAFDALKKFPGPKDAALDQWWNAMSDDEKQKMYTRLGIGFPIQNVSGRNLRSLLDAAVNSGKI